MNRSLLCLALLLTLALSTQAEEKSPQPLRIIVFGAHPDDAEFKTGGVAAKWAKLGHKVKLVSVTNGDIGHWEISGAPLAKRRADEAKAAAAKLGVTAEVLDIHD